MRDPMSSRTITYALAAVVVGIGAFALFGDQPHPATAEATSSTHTTTATTPAPEVVDPSGEFQFPDLPAEHTHGGTKGAPSAAPDLTAPDEPPAITWKAPDGWKTAKNPSALRIATYKVAHAPADAEDADVSVVRAGGTADANIERWHDQFEGASKETRTVKTVHGLKITLVEISGTYLGGAGGTVTSRPGSTLVGAIVETSGLPYFFKMTGGTATVRSARAAFDGLVESLSASESH